MQRNAAPLSPPHAPRAPASRRVWNYHHRTRQQFQQLLENDQVVEHNFYNGNYYGTLN